MDSGSAAQHGPESAELPAPTTLAGGVHYAVYRVMLAFGIAAFAIGLTLPERRRSDI